MNNSIPQVTSIAAAAQSILEAKNTLAKVNTLPVDNLDEALYDIEEQLIALDVTIKNLQEIRKNGLQDYKALEKKHEAVMYKMSRTSTGSHAVEVEVASIRDYREAAVKFLDSVDHIHVTVDQILADKKGFDRSLKFVWSLVKSLDKVLDKDHE